MAWSFFDTGAETTCIGLDQAKAFCCFMRVNFQPKRSNNRYRFGNEKRTALGSNTIRIIIMKTWYLPNTQMYSTPIFFSLFVSIYQISTKWWSNIYFNAQIQVAKFLFLENGDIFTWNVLRSTTCCTITLNSSSFIKMYPIP